MSIKALEYEVRAFISFSPRELAPRMGTSEEVVRTFLRKYYPETHESHKAWNISPSLARQIEQDFKNRARQREAERKLRIEQELAGMWE
jgi:hypothetical protein